MGFTFVGGHVGLDFLATKQDRDRAPNELLTAPAVFARWSVEADLVTASPRVTSSDLVQAVELRESAYRLARAAVRGDSPAESDRVCLNRFAAGRPITVQLDESGSLVTLGDVRQVLATIAAHLVTLLSGSEGVAFRQCDGESCTRLFVDRSRSQNRRFCSDRICGNQAKVAAFRRRSKEQPGQ